MKVRCPQCGQEVVWKETATRPFCSERCRLIDLGAWIEERYAIPGEPLDETLGEIAPPARNGDDTTRS